MGEDSQGDAEPEKGERFGLNGANLGFDELEKDSLMGRSSTGMATASPANNAPPRVGMGCLDADQLAEF